MKELICVVCPKGCHLQVDGEKVTGNQCKRGETYGLQEVYNPVRVLTSTVRMVEGSTHRRCPVKTSEAIPKGMMQKAMTLLCDIELKPPVKMGDVVIENIYDTGIDFVAGRTIK